MPVDADRNYRQAALVLAAHGSTMNADSSRPTREQAERIRALGLFAEVQVCFWKELPYFRDVLAQVKADTVYIVPNFTSEGYFTRQVLPREFGLSGPVSTVGGKTVYYAQPVGVHPHMTEALLHCARQVVAGSDIDFKQSSLLLVGHGTSLNENSATVLRRQVERLRDRGIFAECEHALMEQAPFIRDWQNLVRQRDVVVVPFFISDGLHSYEDIPVLLGISRDVRAEGFSNPTLLSGRRLWYARAVGNDEKMTGVILAQVDACPAADGK